MKRNLFHISLFVMIVIVSVSCAVNQPSPTVKVITILETVVITYTPKPTETTTSSPTLTLTPTFTWTPTGTYTPSPTFTPPPAYYENIVCVDVILDLPGGSSGKPSPRYYIYRIEKMLENADIQAERKWGPNWSLCNADLYVALTGEPIGALYKVQGSMTNEYKMCYTGASFSGEMMVTLSDGSIQKTDIVGKKPPLSGTISYCPKADNAPYEYGWRWPVLKGLAQFWGPHVLIEALDDDDLESFKQNILSELKKMTGQSFGLNISAWRNWWNKNAPPAPTQTPTP